MGILSRLAYRLYAIARKTGLMELGVVQWLAARVYNLVRPRGELSVEVEGSRLHLRPEDRTITPILLANEPFEASETALVKRTVKAGATVVDIGANIGYFSMLFARLVGAEGRVIAFEPEPGNFSLLEKNIGANGHQQIEPHNLALADAAGTLDLFVGEVSQTTSSFIEGNILYEDNVERVAVNTVRLDDFLAEQGVQTVDFIKIDVQGFEATVFRGASELLASTAAPVIMEFWPHGLRKAGTEVSELLETLAGYGFSFNRLDEETFAVHPISQDTILAELSYDDRYFINLYLTKT